ncbi:MAG: response regulator, partial [Pirellulaceae bacterium]|nr:response regulator [Pirellulaceae bacterium]
LRGRFDLDTAEGGPAALEMIRDRGPYAVVVSDMRMPEVDGLHVLSTVRRQHPDTMRVMLTGNVDQKTAIDAVNEGAIFRFLNKPCPAEVLGDTIEAAVRQHHVQSAERTLLTRTLTGTIGLVTEVLSVVNPTAYGRSSRLRQLAHQLCSRLKVEDAWQIEVAAMLSQVGCVAVPENLLAKQLSGTALSAAEQQTLQSQATLGSKLVAKIPRLEIVARMIASTSAMVNSLREVSPNLEELDDPDRVRVLEGAKIIALLTQFDMSCQRVSMSEAIEELHSTSLFDRELIEALSDVVLGDKCQLVVHVKDLQEGMVLEEHVLTQSGDILIAKGHELTQSLIQRIRTFEHNAAGVRQPFRVNCRDRQ